MLTQEQVEQIIIDAKEQLIKSVVEQVRQDVEYQVRRQVFEEISGVVREYVKANVAPAVQEALVGEQSILIESTVTACKGASEALALAMADSLQKKLANSYERGQVLKALFGM